MIDGQKKTDEDTSERLIMLTSTNGSRPLIYNLSFALEDVGTHRVGCDRPYSTHTRADSLDPLQHEKA